MKIDVYQITPRQKLAIAKGLCDYRYIMEYWKQNDSDFQKVFYDFYLKARWAIMNKTGNKEPYFKKLQEISPDDSLIDILKDLKLRMESDSYEFSIGSKLLHTRNPSMPIYDSKVRDYLSAEEKVSFLWYQSGTSRDKSALEKIEYDWKKLREWYDCFLNSEQGLEWLSWFDRCFPAYADISSVKKVDFIIFATN